MHRPLRDTERAYSLPDFGIIIFVSLELPGGRPVSSGNSRLSQPETVSRFETVGKPPAHPLRLRLCGRQLSGRNGIGESACLMRTIAERLVCGVPTTAEPNGGPSGQAKGLAFGIKDFEIAFHTDRSVVVNGNFRGRHFFSQVTLSMPTDPQSDKYKGQTARTNPGRLSSPNTNARRRISTLERTDQPRRTRPGCRLSG